MKIEHSIRMAAPAATIFRLYEDVARWPAWDTDTRAAWRDGPATRVVHRVTLSGPLSLVIAPMLARRIDAGLPATLSRLKAMAGAAAVDA